jgi:hypothetical protein
MQLLTLSVGLALARQFDTHRYHQTPASVGATKQGRRLGFLPDGFAVTRSAEPPKSMLSETTEIVRGGLVSRQPREVRVIFKTATWRDP